MKSLPDGCLVWLDDVGVGVHTAPEITYDGDYFGKYLVYDATPMGEELTRLRCDLVSRHITQPGKMIDIGVGGGAFIKAAGCCGYDVNRSAVDMLVASGRYSDPYLGCHVATFWDSFEHIADIEEIINSVEEWVFMSIPIFSGLEDVKASKHYRPGEHLWYFTDCGLVWVMNQFGFDVVEKNNMETQAGRESIMSYAFKRV